MKHKILYGEISEVEKQLLDIEQDWDIEIQSTDLTQTTYIVIIKILRPKY